MLNEYKNGLRDVLKREGFDPEQFVAEEVEPAGFRLRFLDTQLWFLFENPLHSYEEFRCAWTTFSRLLSTMISISIALSLDTEAGAALLELFKQAFF